MERLVSEVNMAWAVRPGYEHNHIDGRTHVHNVHLFNQVTGGEHNIHLLLGVTACRECHRPYEQSDLGQLDPAAEINKALEALMGNHDAVMEYAGRHGIPIAVGPLHSIIPDGHRVTAHPFGKMLHVPRKMK